VQAPELCGLLISAGYLLWGRIANQSIEQFVFSSRLADMTYSIVRYHSDRYTFQLNTFNAIENAQ
jgi:hypothetical protein